MSEYNAGGTAQRVAWETRALPALQCHSALQNCGYSVDAGTLSNRALPSVPPFAPRLADYGSNLGDFLDAHAVKNITNIHSVKDLANSWEEVEAAFCDKEA